MCAGDPDFRAAVDIRLAGLAEGVRETWTHVPADDADDADGYVTLNSEAMAKPVAPTQLHRLRSRAPHSIRHDLRGDIARGGIGAILALERGDADRLAGRNEHR